MSNPDHFVIWDGSELNSTNYAVLFAFRTAYNPFATTPTSTPKKPYPTKPLTPRNMASEISPPEPKPEPKEEPEPKKVAPKRVMRTALDDLDDEPEYLKVPDEPMEMPGVYYFGMSMRRHIKIINTGVPHSLTTGWYQTISNSAPMGSGEGSSSERFFWGMTPVFS